MRRDTYRRVRRLSRERQAQAARADRRRQVLAALESPEHLAAVRAWEGRFLAARPDLHDTVRALDRVLARSAVHPDDPDLVSVLLDGRALAGATGLLDVDLTITLSDGATEGDPADPRAVAGWVCVAIQTLDGAIQEYERETGDLRAELDPPPAEDAPSGDDAQDDAQGEGAEDPRDRWAGILPADVLARPRAPREAARDLQPGDHLRRSARQADRVGCAGHRVLPDRLRRPVAPLQPWRRVVDGRRALERLARRARGPGRPGRLFDP